VVVGPGGGTPERGGDAEPELGVVLEGGAVVVVDVEGTVDSARGAVVEVVATAGAVGGRDGALAELGLSSDVHPTGGAVAPV
jgi:hypothetical protein